MIIRDEKRRISGVENRSRDIENERHVIVYGDSMDEVQAYLRDKPAIWDSAGHGSNNPPSPEWDLNVGYTGALLLAKDGWPEGTERIHEALQAIVPSTGREARWGYAQTGGSVSVGRYLTGHPKCMRNRRKKQMGAAPVLHICVNTAASCMVKAEQMANYGAAVTGLIDRLENMGRRCHVDVIMVTNLWAGKARCSVGWNVKRASEHVDIGQIAFSIAHPAAFRRLGFAMMERTPKNCQTGGYGRCLDGAPDDVPDYTDGTMILDGINHEYQRCNTPKDALRLAIEQINKAAVLAGHATVDAPLIDETEWLENLPE